jgi:hypothetical protein
MGNDGRGRAPGSVFGERLWRSVKPEDACSGNDVLLSALIARRQADHRSWCVVVSENVCGHKNGRPDNTMSVASTLPSCDVITGADLG